MVRQKQRGQEESEGDRRPAEPGGKEVRPEIREILWPPREQSAPEPGAEEPEQPEELEQSERPEKPETTEASEEAQKQAEEKECPQWDYERLFAEGEAEKEELRRRRIQELREKNRVRTAAREQEQRRRSADEEESWAAVMAAAHALSLIHI